MTFLFLWVYIKYICLTKKFNKMKKIIIRSLRVALVLAILSASVIMLLFKSPWFLILTFATIFFLDASDSMLVYRLKRITVARTKTSLIYAYVATAIIAVYLCICVNLSNIGPIKDNPYTLMKVMYSGLIAIFALRYVIILTLVSARFDVDDEYY